MGVAILPYTIERSILSLTGTPPLDSMASEGMGLASFSVITLQTNPTRACVLFLFFAVRQYRNIYHIPCGIIILA
jgi:hypothetical protein